MGFGQLLVTMSVVAAAGLSGVSGAAVDAPAGGAVAEADRIMNLSYREFVDYKFGPSHGDAFDLTSDGCSPPATNLGLAEIFDQPCQLHDFGYRNYGGRFGLSPDEGTRRWIDDRFHEEMDRLCRDTHQGFTQQGNRQVCFYQSDSIYAQIRSHGRGAFYDH